MSETIIQRRYRKQAERVRAANAAQDAIGWPNDETRRMAYEMASALEGAALNKKGFSGMEDDLRERKRALGRAWTAAVSAS